MSLTAESIDVVRQALGNDLTIAFVRCFGAVDKLVTILDVMHLGATDAAIRLLDNRVQNTPSASGETLEKATPAYAYCCFSDTSGEPLRASCPGAAADS